MDERETHEIAAKDAMRRGNVSTAQRHQAKANAADAKIEAGERKKQRRFKFEVALAVASYNCRHSPPPTEMFDACMADCESAIKEAKDELAQAGVDELTQERLQFTARFLEFDSPNWTHAGGLFEVCLTGNASDIKDARRKWTLWFNA